MSVPREHSVYADWLAWGTRIALVVLGGVFIAYVFGWLAPLVSFDRLPIVWTYPVSRYVQETGAPTGWSWLAAATRGDYANLAGVAMLSIVTVVCYLRIIPILLRRGERLLAVLAGLQVAILLIAASGLLATAH